MELMGRKDLHAASQKSVVLCFTLPRKRRNIHRKRYLLCLNTTYYLVQNKLRHGLVNQRIRNIYLCSRDYKEQTILFHSNNDNLHTSKIDTTLSINCKKCVVNMSNSQLDMTIYQFQVKSISILQSSQLTINFSLEFRLMNYLLLLNHLD